MKSISKHYRDFIAVENVSLSIAPGRSMTSWLNGAEKTITIRMLLGILLFAAVFGYWSSVLWWKHADQKG